MLGDQLASDRRLPLGQRRRLKRMARAQANLATVLVSSQSVAAQMRPELPVPLATQMALHSIIDGVSTPESLKPVAADSEAQTGSR